MIQAEHYKTTLTSYAVQLLENTPALRDLNTQCIHPSWQSIVQTALSTVAPDYLDNLSKSLDWLPGKTNIFKAFTLPLDKTTTILFGESPYPRADSANGYAFWDNRVGVIWSESGLSKSVNRATSLRNIIKTLLHAEGLLADDYSQRAISLLNKDKMITTLAELFENMQAHGILLLNASLVLSEQRVATDAKAWRPFMQSLLRQLSVLNPNITLLLFGKIAQEINTMPEAHSFNQIIAEHPYNISFIENESILNFFRPLHLLRKRNDS